MKTIKEILIILYSEILESYSNKNELYMLRNSMTFYEFIEKQFEKYRKLCSEIKEEDLVLISKGEFKGECTKKRFMNMINRLSEVYLTILKAAYKGDYYHAYETLNMLMTIKGHTKLPFNQYLDDDYINCINCSIKNEELKLYRMRDIGKDESSPKDCWHVPFVMRRYASFQRYNMYGIPCLYLADSLETANAEVGPLEDNKNRWYSEFRSNSSNKRKEINAFDLTIKTEEEINREDSNNYLLYWLITYPLRLLCSIKVYEKGNFCEEYIFPQLLFHWMYFSGNGFRDGFMFSSTKNSGGINYVFPATYKSKTPPTYSDKQVSEKLEQLFVQSKPILYLEGKEKKKYTIEITEI